MEWETHFTPGHGTSTIQFTQAKTSPQQNVANLLRLAESIIEL